MPFLILEKLDVNQLHLIYVHCTGVTETICLQSIHRFTVPPPHILFNSAKNYSTEEGGRGVVANMIVQTSYNA